MLTIPRSPREHYDEAERLLRLAGNAAAGDAVPVLERLRIEALIEAGVHATLALAPPPGPSPNATPRGCAAAAHLSVPD